MRTWLPIETTPGGNLAHHANDVVRPEKREVASRAPSPPARAWGNPRGEDVDVGLWLALGHQLLLTEFSDAIRRAVEADVPDGVPDRRVLVRGQVAPHNDVDPRRCRSARVSEAATRS